MSGRDATPDGGPGGITSRAPIVGLTLRGLLDRRRTWLMVLFAAAPVIVALLTVVTNQSRFPPNAFATFIVGVIVPLVALVFGTAAIGSELEDGTIVYLVTRPVRRVRIAIAKGAVAAALTVALVVPATLLTGIVASFIRPSLLEVGTAYAVAVALGATAYALGFMALSTLTSRALAVGLGYVLLWEGILSGLLEGTRVFSVRQATIGVAASLSAEVPRRQGVVDTGPALAFLVVVILASLALTTWRLSRYESRGGD